MAKVLIGNFKGPKGDKGDKGDVGTAATIQVGTTQTVQPEENAEVTNSGTTSAAVLNFKIPRGEDGMTDLTAEYKDASEYTCQPTVNAPVVVKQVDGKTEQVVTTGAQLFDVKSYPFSDGYWIDYNLGYVSSNENYKCTNFIPFSGYDGLTINLNPVPSGSNQGMAFYSSNTQESYLSGGKGSAITVPEGTQYMRFTVDANVSDNDVMLNKGSTPLPWEPYTGGSPAPSPDYPQVIKGVGGIAGGSDFSTAVETQGRNLFDASKIATTTNSGVTVTNNGDGSFSVSGQSSESVVVVSYTTQHNDTKNILKAGTLKLGTDKNTNPYFFFQVHNEDKSILKELHNSPSNAITSIEITESDLLDDTLKIWSGFYFSFNVLNPVTPGTIFPMVYQSGDSTYQPYHHTAITIPLTSPLFNGDKICYVKPGESYVNAEGETVTADRVLYGCYRENASVVFDGSEDEVWFKSPLRDDLFGINITDKVISYDESVGYIKCDKLMHINNNLSVSLMPDNSIKADVPASANTQTYVVISEAGNDISTFKTWLSTNPLTIVYRLAQPYFEPFSDQSIFYDLRTDDTLTYIYSNDPIEPNITVDVAKNDTGGILLESYATAQKNALAEADNASRLAEVEQQLLTLNTTVSTMGGQ